MSNVIISPNMGLPVPVVGQEPGPDWANDINACLGTLDQHDHSPGQGDQITPAGLNINSDLPINSNNLTLVKTINFAAQVSTLAGLSPNLGCLYVAGNELVYNDEAGNVVAITHNGVVNAGAGTITGLPSGTASASYQPLSETFLFQSATLTPANLDAGSIVLRNILPSSHSLTLNPQNAMASDYSITLPAANGSGNTAFLTYDTSNNIGVGPSTSQGITASNIANKTITAAQIADHTITSLQLATSVGTVPAGVYVPYGGTSSPTGWLMCDGASYLRVSFADLFSAIGTAYGSADGTHFNVPDMRGYFVRGTDNGAGHDPDSSSRTALNPGGNTGDNVGSFQSDQYASHSHIERVALGVSGTLAPSTANATLTQTSGASTEDSGGNETRPKNVNTNFIIKT